MRLFFLRILAVLAILQVATSHGDQPLSRIAIHRATFAVDERAYVTVSPSLLGLNVSFIVCYFVHIREKENQYQNPLIVVKLHFFFMGGCHLCIH